jgi:hypothetical protein
MDFQIGFREGRQDGTPALINELNTLDKKRQNETRNACVSVGGSFLFTALSFMNSDSTSKVVLLGFATYFAVASVREVRRVRRSLASMPERIASFKRHQVEAQENIGSRQSTFPLN